jgi:hypothetical protein
MISTAGSSSTDASTADWTLEVAPTTSTSDSNESSFFRLASARASSPTMRTRILRVALAGGFPAAAGFWIPTSSRAFQNGN